LRSFRALLLLLLRPHPTGVLSWASEDVNAEPEVLLLAAAMIGVAASSRHLPSSLHVSDQYSCLILRWATTVPGLDQVSAPTRADVVSLQRDGRHINLLIGRNVATTWTALGHPQRLVWQSSLSPTDQLAVGVAETCNWTDCLMTVAVARMATVEPARGAVRVVMDGRATVRQEVVVEQFLARLAEVDDTALDAAIEAAQAVGPRPKAQARKRRK
jgi:hypothetical protein